MKGSEYHHEMLTRTRTPAIVRSMWSRTRAESRPKETLVMSGQMTCALITSQKCAVGGAHQRRYQNAALESQMPEKTTKVTDYSGFMLCTSNANAKGQELTRKPQRRWHHPPGVYSGGVMHRNGTRSNWTECTDHKHPAHDGVLLQRIALICAQFEKGWGCFAFLFFRLRTPAACFCFA